MKALMKSDETMAYAKNKVTYLTRYISRHLFNYLNFVE